MSLRAAHHISTGSMDEVPFVEPIEMGSMEEVPFVELVETRCVSREGRHALVAHHEVVMILLWLLPTAIATALAMAFVGWIGRARPDRERSSAEQERFAAAIERPLPQAARPRPGAGARERSTGVATRRSA